MHLFLHALERGALTSPTRALFVCAALASSAQSLAGCAVAEPVCSAPNSVARDSSSALRVLTYNIGHAGSRQPYALRLSDCRYEQAVGRAFAELAPDLVFLQEVLAPSQCEGFTELDPQRSCFDFEHDAPQVRRLLGDAYSIACDANQHVECIGVRRSFGTIRGLEAGGIDLAGATTAALPGRPCDYLDGKCSGRSNGCDAESSISTVVIDTKSGAVRAIHVHPTAIGRQCLQRQLVQAFAFADELPSIAAGDWNFDPSSATDLVASSIWERWVGAEARFVDHSPRDRHCRLQRTSVGQDSSLDRVISDFAHGACHVWSEPRLDEGADFSRLEGPRIDHFAVDCVLELDSEQT